jgi:hypothetical protein
MDEGVVVVLVTVIIMMKRLSRRHITVSEEEEVVVEEEETVVRRSIAIIHKEETEIETIHLYLPQIGTGHPLLEIGTGISHPVLPLPLHPCLVEIGMAISLLRLRLPDLPVLIFTADRADFPVTLEQAGL